MATDDPKELVAHHATFLVILFFIGLALYNVVELNFQIFSTFKKFRGLYFWSFLIGTWGVAFNAVGYLLRTLKAVNSVFIYATVLSIGWLSMINCQSLVLYSRLHIVLHNPTILRAVLIMIIVNAIWIDIPLTVLAYGSMSTNPKPYSRAYAVYEKIQLPVFFVQELIISSLYVYETTKLRMLRVGAEHKNTRRVMDHVIFVNILVILLDVSLLTLEYLNLYDVQTAWKPLVYSIKLKLEFSILNRLVKMTQQLGRSGFGHTRSRTTGIDGTGVALSTFPTHNGQAEKSLESTGYKVNDGTRQGFKNGPESKVVASTEITIDRDITDTNDDSVYDNSGTTEEIVVGGAQDAECSSEEEFATRGS